MSIVSLFRSSLHRLSFARVALLAMAPLALHAQSNLPSAADGFDPNVDGIVYAVAVQPDGKVLVAGKFTSLQPNGSGTAVSRNNLARLNPDGSVDASFNPNVNNQINALALQPDGKIVIGGVFTSVSSSSRVCLARLNADGSLDASLNPTFANQLSPAIYALALQADGKIVVGGAFTAVVPAGAATATVRNRVARFNADGSLDASFNPNADSTVYSLAVQADGRIVIGGQFTTLQPSGDPTARNHVARLNADGSIDAAFDPDTNGSVMVLAIQPDGGILMGGFFTTIAPNGADPATARSYLARFNLDGSPDATFNPNATANITALAVQADGGILVGGLFTGIGGGNRSYFARLDGSGLLDLFFDSGVNYVVNAIAPQVDGKIVIGGNFSQLRPAGLIASTRNHLARLQSDGTPDVNFDPNIGGRVAVMATQADGKVIFGGSFSSVGGLARNNLARSNADGTIDGSFDPNVDGTVSALAVQADGKILVGGTFSSVGGLPRNDIARLNPDGTLDTAFDPNANGAVVAIAVQADGKILIGGFFAGLQPNGATDVTARGNLARLNADGTLDTSFIPLFNGEVLALKVLSDGRIMASGNFIALDPNGFTFASTQSFIIRLTSAGAVDTTFSAGPDNKVESFAVQDDGKIVIAGIFSQLEPNSLIAPTFRNRIARLNTDGSVDPGFDPNAGGEVRTVALQPDGKILLGGGFLTLKPNGSSDTIARNYFARLNADGTVDTSFDARATGAVNALLVQADGKIVLGGAFIALQPNGTPTVAARTHLARLNADGTLDSAYNPTFANAPGGVVKTLALQTDGKILLGGLFGKIAGSPSDNLVRFNLDGSLDLSFNPGADGAVNAIGVQVNKGLLVTQGNGFAWLNSDGLLHASFAPSANVQIVGEVNAVATQADGSILLGGAFANLSGATNGNLVRIKPDGTLDTSFNPNPNGQVTAIVVQPDGKILLGGGFSSLQPNGEASPTARNRVARINPDGTVDDGFDPNASDQVNAIVLLPDGRIVIGGAFITLQPNGAATAVTSTRLARLNSDGTLDTSFTPSPNDQVTALALQSDGKILVGGLFNELQSTTRNRIGRLNADGTLDPGFDPNSNGTVLTIKVQSDGLILLGGAFSTIGGWVRTGVARIFPDGGNDPSFDVSINGVVESVALQPNNQILLAGTFSNVAGVTRNNLARINGDSTLDANFDPNFDSQVDKVLLQPDGSMLVSGIFSGLRPYGVIMVGGSFSHMTGAAVSNLALLNEDGNANGSFNPNPNGAVNTIVAQPDGRLLVGGAFTTMAGTAHNRLARFNADGTLDASFNPDAGDQVYTLAVQADGKIVVGGAFTALNGTARNRLARLNADGSLDVTFNPDAGDSVYTLVVQPDGSLVAGGAFTTMGGTARNRLARLSAGGSVDGSFNPDANGPVNALALQADGQIIVGGAFTAIGGTARNYLARVGTNGSVDAAFDPAADDAVSALTLQSDGKPVIGGSFDRVGGQARYRFARLAATSSATQSLTLGSDLSTLTWTRGGSAPELAWVTFEQSSDNAVWTAIGQASRIGTTSNWQLDTSALPKTTAFFVRVRGALPSSQYGSSGLVETVQKFSPSSGLAGASTDNGSSSNVGAGTARFSASNLPAGLSFDPVTGIIFGTPAQPGTYTVALNAIGGGTITQTLVYGAAAEAARSRPVNTSIRALVSDGHPIFVGFIVTGSESKTVLLRAVGPGLSAFNVPGVLAAPHLRLFDASGQLLLQNDGWGNDSNLAAAFETVGAFPFAPGSADAAAVTTLAPGAYTIQVVAGSGASGVALAEVYDASSSQSTDTARFGNMSARGPSAGSGNPLIAGFVISGTSPKRLLVRGIGPGLTSYGVTDALSDPIVGVYDQNGHLIAQNDNWSTPLTVDASQPASDAATIAASASNVGAFALDAGGRDASVIVTLAPGLYTVQVSGVNNVTGSALAELYELP